MNLKDESQQLTYGSIISISHFLDDNSFITVEGFIEQNVMLRNDLKKTSPFSNNLFQIFPKFNNATKGDIMKLFSDQEQEESGLLEPDIIIKDLIQSQREIENMEEPQKLSKDDIVQFQENLINETKYNIHSFEKSRNIKIQFKQPIQLLHVVSSRFLACYQKESKANSSNYLITLDDYSSDATLFKILPSYQFQKEGEQVIYARDIVYIVRAQQFMNKETYIHASTIMHDNRGDDEDSKSDDSQQKKGPNLNIMKYAAQLKASTRKAHFFQMQDNGCMDIQISDSVIKKGEIYGSIEQKTQWKISIFSQYISETQQNLKCGDVIWLHHSETNSTISAALKGIALQNEGFNKFNLMKWMKFDNMELKIMQADIKESYDEYIGESNSMWIIEHEDVKQGGLVEYKKKYKFRHLSTGYYLEGIPYNKKQSDRQCLKLSQVASENSHFYFIPLKNTDVQDQYIKKASFVYIKNYNSFWMDVNEIGDDPEFENNQLQQQEQQQFQKQNSETSSKKKKKIQPNLNQQKNKKLNNAQNLLQLKQQLNGQLMEQFNKQDIVQYRYYPYLHCDSSKEDQSVFKLYSSTAHDVWEIMFLVYSLKSLKKFYRFHNKRCKQEKGERIKQKDIKKLEKQVMRIQLIIVNLTNFCCNKFNNSQLGLRYDSINQFRQRLMKEQNFIDILIKLLTIIMTKDDLDIWIQRKNILDKYKQLQNKNQNKGKSSNDKDILDLVILKVSLSKDIYKLIGSICKDNVKNQIYTYKFISNLLEHIQYIPESIDFIMSILQGNEILIQQLSEGLELDLVDRKIEQMDQQIVQVLNSRQSRQSSVQSFQSEYNLLEWFVTLLNKENISHRTKILGFLRFVCKFGDRGVNLNQEIIYKLIKKIQETELKIGVIVKNENEIEMPDQYKLVSINNKLLLPVQCKNPREQEFIIEQLQFFADVSYDRNHLWGYELRNQFKQEYLFNMIWNIQSEEIIKKLQPSFCKLAMSLYVDCYPFDRKQLPSLCKLYSDVNHLKIQSNNMNSDQEKQFKGLIENLMYFLDKIKQQILNTFDKDNQQKNENNQIQYQKIDKQEIYSEILYNSTDLLLLIIDLDIIQIIYKDPQETFKKMVEILISLLMYDSMNQDYMSLMMKYQKQQVDRRRKKFKDENEFKQIQSVFDLFKFFKQKAQQAFKDVQAKAQSTVQGVKDNISGSKKNDEEDDDLDNQDNSNDFADDITMSTNPLIRGCIKLHIKLSSLIKDNFKMTDLEINIKLKICDIFDQLLDLRQEYLMNNLLNFFKNDVIKNNKFDEDDIENNIIQCQKIIQENYLGLLPNIPKTGILSIDEPENDKQISFQDMLKKLKEMQQQSQKKKQFFNFQKNNIINDLDLYYSMALSESDSNIDYIGVLLPQFLTTAYFVNNEDLESRVISILMRIYNQRQELITNIQNLQVIFDSTKTKLYTLLEKYHKELQNYVDQSEIWLTNFVRQIKSNNSIDNQEIQQTLSIMQSVRWGFFNEINVENNQISLQKPENQLTVDVLKQSLQRSLNTYLIIICLIRDQIQHLVECIRNKDFPISQKTQISILFINAFQYLKYFCMRNYQNQMLLFEHSHIFTNKLQFNIGQIGLICEIFKDNDKLLSNEIDLSFLQIFVDCIEKYGRQKRFLEPLITILLNKSTYKFDNQLLVLNLFLPGQNISEINHKLLFSKEIDKSIVFDFEGKVSLIENDFIQDIYEGIHQFHEPYYYHKKLIDLLISTTLINKIGDDNFYNYIQSDLSLNDNFTINAARLRKIFTSNYLIELLIKPDHIINHVSFHFHRHNQHNPAKNPITVDSKQEEEQLNSQRGMTILKCSLCHFLRLIHITSEKIHHSDSDLENEFYKLLKFESERISQIKDDVQSNTYNKYTEYLTEGLLPLFMSFYERILKDYNGHKQTNEKNSNMEDEQVHEENINLKYLQQFANQLSQKIIHSLYNNIQSFKQVMILEKFFDDHQNTQYYQIFKLRNEKEQTQNIIDCTSHIFGLYQKRNINDQKLINQNNNEIHNMFEENKFQEEQNFPQEEQKLIDKQQSKEIKLQFQAAKNNIIFLAKKIKHQEIQQIQDESSMDNAEKINKIWFIFRKEFSSIKIIEDQIKKEQETLAAALLNIENISSDIDIKQKSSNKLTFSQIASKFIEYLLFSVNKPKNKQTIINLLNVLEKIVISKKDEEKIEIQNNLNNLGSTRIILIVLSESSSNLDSETYRYFLMFINALLEGGNNKVQKTVYEFFTTYQKSEVIFQRFNQVIQTQIDQISIKAQQKKKKQQAQISLQYEDLDEDEANEQEILQAEEDEKVMNQVLKFLQNCVEGHYLDLQNYIRQQTSSRNSYNIIKMVTELLYAYYQNRSQQMYDNMIKCLDTLNELVQGPCSENQTAVAESKFFEMANELFSKINQKGDNNQSSLNSGVSFYNKSLKTATTSALLKSSTAVLKNVNLQDDITEWMVARLQMKSLILVLSLIEQQQLSDQNPIIKLTMRNLPINLLQDQMIKQFKLYQQIYSQEYIQEVFDHYQNDPRDMDNLDKLHPKYLETIIQNGFYSFFIICYYMESNPKLNNQFVQMYRTFLKKKLHISKSGLEDIIYGDNIIGQIISLIRGIIESILLAATEKILQNLKNKGDTLTPEQLKEQQKAYEELEKKVQQQSFDFYMRNTACIEIFRNQQIELIYFYILPHMTTIPKEKKNEFSEQVERSSTKSKVQGLMDYANIIIDICEHEEKLRIFFSKNKILAIFANYEKLWKDLAFLFTIVLNILIIGSFALIDGGDRMNDYNLFQNPDYSTKDSERIFKICGSIMTACSIFVLVIFLIKNVPLIIKKAWDQKIPILEDQKDKWYMWQFIIIIKLMTILIFLLQEIDVVYYLCYGIFAVLGTLWHPFFFSFHLTELLIRFPTLKNVVKSVYIPRKQFGLTFILFIIFEYVFSIVGFSFFSNSYQGTCETVLYCFLTTADQTFFSNGGVGGWLTGNDVDNNYNTQNNSKVPTYEWKRFLFDNLSNIILVIIMVNIWSGIIIDTFGSLREAEENKNQDIEDKCFICGNLKSTFDKLQDAATDGGFDHHIKINHYMWNYVNFIAYLNKKDPNDYNGIEQYVIEKINKNDLTWFPFNVSREIKQEEDLEVQILTQLYEQTSSAAESLAKASQNLYKFKEKILEETTAPEQFESNPIMIPSDSAED